MKMIDYVGKTDYSLIQFSYNLTTEVSFKIKTKKLFYSEQVWKYIHTRVDGFINHLNVRDSLKSIYRRQILTMISIKVTSLIHKNKMLGCI